MEYNLIDNFLKEEDFNRIKHQMLDDSNFAWFLNSYITNSAGDGQEDDDFQFTHTFYNDWKWQSEWVPMLTPILMKINPKAWLRIKANLGVRQSEIKEQGWHVDFDFPCTTAILYLNDNNGYTIFEDGTKVESKANRFVEFHSQFKHSGTSHTDTAIRSVINFNYIKDGGM